MFSGCTSLCDLNISKFDTSNTITMTNMFHNCSKLSSIDLSHFETEFVIDMSYMFSDLASLIIILNFLLIIINMSKISITLV